MDYKDCKYGRDKCIGYFQNGRYIHGIKKSKEEIMKIMREVMEEYGPVFERLAKYDRGEE